MPADLNQGVCKPEEDKRRADQDWPHTNARSDYPSPSRGTIAVPFFSELRPSGGTKRATRRWPLCRLVRRQDENFVVLTT